MFSQADLLELHRRMLVIRGFEQRVAVLYRDGEVPGFVHLSIGQEASAVGACWPLSAHDVITSTHRGHGHCLAKGLGALGMFAELMAKDAGTNRGRGGSMHIADPRSASSAPTASSARACRSRWARPLHRSCVTTAPSRSRSSATARSRTARFHEAVNLAAVWQLPVIFFCEDNGYAEFSPASTQHAASLAQRAAGYGIGHVAVDGNDVVATATAMHEVVDGVRAGGGPVLVEATTYRWHGHYEGDPERYRTPEEKQEWEARDPLVISARHLRDAGVSDAALAEMDGRDRSRARRRRRRRTSAGAAPAVETLGDFVTRPRRGPTSPPSRSTASAPPPSDAPVFRVMDAVHDALEVELASDERVFVAGIDVAAGGNVFGLTRGLHAEFGERVRDTPISESAIVGLGVGAAMAGMRPVVELMYLDFLGVCLDQLLNQAAKLPFMTGGAAQMALTVRTQFGAGRSSGSQHSQSLEALLAHIPGLTVVMPSTPADTYGLLRAAIQDPNPVVFIENRLLYGMKGPRPPADHVLPIGRAAIVRPGTDVTLVSVSRMVHDVLAAAERSRRRASRSR